MQTRWSERFALRARGMRSSAVRELLKLTEQPDIISFGGGLPAPEVFPTERFRESCDRVLKHEGAKALQYSTTEGFRPLREMIARHAVRFGINIRAEHVLLTSGSQQALDLIGSVFVNPGDHLLVERPTYLGALQAWRAYQAEYACVSMDDDGMRTDEVESQIRTGPKFIYALPNFQNPGGVTLSYERRLALVDIADRYGVPIIEDDPYGELRFEGEHLPPLVVLDADKLNGRQYNHQNEPQSYFQGNVIYMSTFSKTLAPGLRLGWIVAPERVIQHCIMAKQGMDLHTSSFVQMVAYEVAKDGFLTEHVRQIRDVYRERRDVMLAAMSEHFPPGVRWTKPQGGLFLWVALPEDLDSTAVLEEAIAHKVAFVPGATFYPNGEQKNSFRLNFSNAQPAQIEEGIARLGQVLQKVIDPIPA